MWHGLRTITDYKAIDTALINADSAFTNEPNEFYTRFEVCQVANANYCLTTEDGDFIREGPTIIIAEHDVRAAQRRVRARKAAGADGITEGVFTSIFNKSLAKATSTLARIV